MCLSVGGLGYCSSERVCLPVGGLGYSSGGCAYQLVGLDTVQSGHLNGCAYQLAALAGALTSWQLLQQDGQGGFGRDFQVARAMFVKIMPDVRLTTC